MHNKLAPKVGVVRVTWPKFKIWDPLHNFGTDKDTHVQILWANTFYEALCRNMKIWLLKGRGLGHVTIFEILESLYIFGMTKDRNFVFGAHTDHDMC